MNAQLHLSHDNGDIRCVLTIHRIPGGRHNFVLSPIEAVNMAHLLQDYAAKIMRVPASARYESLVQQLEAVR